MLLVRRTVEVFAIVRFFLTPIEKGTLTTTTTIGIQHQSLLQV